MRDLMLKAAAWQQARQPREEGQTVVEYALVVALVSLVIIGVLATVGENDAPSSEVVIRYALSVPPGLNREQKSDYSNFLYCVLGRVIERTAAGLLRECVNCEAFV